jgi:hypothetical protein
MTDYLHERTALLPRVDLSEPVTAIGTSTKDAILAGAAIGYRGMVKGILEALRKELDAPKSSPRAVMRRGSSAAWRKNRGGCRPDAAWAAAGGESGCGMPRLTFRGSFFEFGSREMMSSEIERLTAWRAVPIGFQRGGDEVAIQR